MCTRSINDPVHGRICLPEISMKIINLAVFRRLQKIKWLGNAYRVFPTALHTVFDHSIGSAYIARQMINKIRGANPSLGLTDEDCLVVEISSLVRNVGKGCFNELFEKISQKCGREEFSYEEQSTEYFLTDIISNIKGDLEKLGIDVDRFEKTVCSLIKGKSSEKCRQYMASIVNGPIDADIFDRVARDLLFCGFGIEFDVRFMIDCVSVKISEDGGNYLTFSSEGGQYYAMAFTRAYNNLGVNVYNNVYIKVYDAMVLRVFELAAESKMSPSLVVLDHSAFIDGLLDSHQIISRDDISELYSRIENCLTWTLLCKCTTKIAIKYPTIGNAHMVYYKNGEFEHVCYLFCEQSVKSDNLIAELKKFLSMRGVVGTVE